MLPPSIQPVHVHLTTGLFEIHIDRNGPWYYFRKSHRTNVFSLTCFTHSYFHAVFEHLHPNLEVEIRSIDQSGLISMAWCGTSTAVLKWKVAWTCVNAEHRDRSKRAYASMTAYMSIYYFEWTDDGGTVSRSTVESGNTVHSSKCHVHMGFHKRTVMCTSWHREEWRQQGQR